jgi:hypothetical protein
MSEYQYYEFLAVDRPLDERQQAEVRALSTRARITATSFTNERSPTRHAIGRAWRRSRWRSAEQVPMRSSMPRAACSAAVGQTAPMPLRVCRYC